MLKPENAAQNAEYIGYSTPNKKAKDLLPKEISQDEQFYPSDETISHLEVYEDLGPKFLGIYNDLFLEFCYVFLKVQFSNFLPKASF